MLRVKRSRRPLQRHQQETMQAELFLLPASPVWAFQSKLGLTMTSAAVLTMEQLVTSLP